MIVGSASQLLKASRLCGDRVLAAEGQRGAGRPSACALACLYPALVQIMRFEAAISCSVVVSVYI